MHQSEDGQKGQLKTLRILYWLAFVFFWAGFPLCIAHGVVSNQVLPALGLIPTFASMVTSVYRVYQLRKKDSEYQIIIGERQRKSTMSEHFTVYWALLDLAIINFDLLIYIFTCIVTFGKWGNRSDALGAYATMFLLFDILIHTYLLLKFISTRSWGYDKHNCATSCPNCRIAREAADGTNRYRDMAEPAPSGDEIIPSDIASSA